MEEAMQEFLPEGWSTDGYGESFMFICPCGETVEQDGECYNGHVSPMIQMGMI